MVKSIGTGQNHSYVPAKSPIKRVRIADDEHRTKYADELYHDMEDKYAYSSAHPVASQKYEEFTQSNKVLGLQENIIMPKILQKSYLNKGNQGNQAQNQYLYGQTQTQPNARQSGVHPQVQ